MRLEGCGGIWVDFKVLTYIRVAQTNERTLAIPRDRVGDAGAETRGK